MSASILVTGASGMVGANLVRRLAARGDRVSVLVRPPGNAIRLDGLGDELVRVTGDIADRRSVLDAVEQTQPDVVFHLAATAFNPPTADAARHVEVNALGTLYLLEALRGATATRLVYTGSAAVYGEGAALREDRRLAPATLLGAGKACAAILVDTYRRLHGLDAVELRLFTPYGPWERPGRLIPGAILSALDGRDMEIGDGRQKRDYVYIDDAVDALLLAAGRPGPVDAVYNVCSGQGVPVREVAETVLRLLGDPVRLLVGARPTRPDEIWELSGDPAAARDGLGWTARTGLEDGLGRTIEWFRENRAIAGRLT